MSLEFFAKYFTSHSYKDVADERNCVGGKSINTIGWSRESRITRKNNDRKTRAVPTDISSKFRLKRAKKYRLTEDSHV